MKKIGMILLLLVLVFPSLVFSDFVTFKLGYFFPRAGSDLWTTEFENMTFEKTDFTGSIFGFAYEYFVSREIAIQFSVDGYHKQKSGVYMEWDGLDDYDGRWAYPRETLPYVGFIPTTPQWDAGWRTEPPVSEPMAPMHMSADTAAADPPLDPPGILSGSQGLRVNLKP